MTGPVFINYGTPVVSTRQWTTGLSPNAAGTGWNFISQSIVSNLNPAQWYVVKNLTDTPTAHSSTAYDATSVYANVKYKYTNPAGANQQLRAPNGRIFWPLFGNYTGVYDPTTEAVSVIGPIVESPPINEHASTILYSAAFDTVGNLYMATQESQSRPTCVSLTDTTTLAQSVVGYAGSGSNAYTTYGYYLAPDTGTSTKFIYVSYGQDPWQLWAINISNGAATKLYEVPSTGRITFTDIVGQGWIAVIDTNVGQSSNVRTNWWCLDGALYAYTVSVAPPGGLARNVTPALTPLVNAPDIDSSGGAGVVGWRAHGSSDPYTYINYPVNYATPQLLESLVDTPTGILGNATLYQGFFSVTASTKAVLWYGVEGGLDISQGPRLNVPGAGGAHTIYFAGYPDGVLYAYDPAQAWQAATAPPTNPALLGYFGPSGILYAGIKYSTALAWSATAGASGRLYCCGTRERSGTGAGIGYYDKTTKAFAGTYASPLDIVQPTGMVALDSISRVVMATNTLSGTGTAPIYVFDQSLSIVSTQTPIAAADLGELFTTANGAVVCGVMQSGGALAVYRHNVQTNTLLQFAISPYLGVVGGTAVNPADSTIWVAVGGLVISVSPETLSMSVVLNIAAIAPVSSMAFSSTGLYMVSGYSLYGYDTSAAPPVVVPTYATAPTPDKISDLDAFYIVSLILAMFGSETASGGAVIDCSVATTLLTVDGAQAFVMPDGTFAGQRHRIECVSATNTPAGTLTIKTPDTTVGFACSSTFVFNTKGQALTLRWTGTAWRAERVQRAGVLPVVVGTTVLTGLNLNVNYALSVTGTVSSTGSRAIPNGSAVGERIVLSNPTAASSPVGNINFVGTSLLGAAVTNIAAIGATTDTIQMEWGGTSWVVFYQVGITLG